MNHKTNLGIRAVLHTVRKWKKTLLLFFLLLFITTLVLSGLAIADAQEEQSEELRGVTGASFTVNANNGYTHAKRMNGFSYPMITFSFFKWIELPPNTELGADLLQTVSFSLISPASISPSFSRDSNSIS